jgi:hypothetical protein
MLDYAIYRYELNPKLSGYAIARLEVVAEEGGGSTSQVVA